MPMPAQMRGRRHRRVTRSRPPARRFFFFFFFFPRRLRHRTPLPRYIMQFFRCRYFRFDFFMPLRYAFDDVCC